MKIDTNSLVTILSPNNKAIQLALGEISQNSNQNYNIEQLLKDLYSELFNGSKSKASIENLLNNPNFLKSLGSFSSNITSLLNLVKNHKELLNKLQTVITSFGGIENIDEKNIKELLKNSGVFLESKLLNSNPNLTYDLKAILLQIQNDTNDTKDDEILKTTAKLLTQIDYFQLLSLTSGTDWMYLPFSWEEFEYGKIGFKKQDKNSYYCEIELNLKSYDLVKIQLLLGEGNYLNIMFDCDNPQFNKDLKEKLTELKSELNKLNLITNIGFRPTNKKIENLFLNEQSIDLGISINA